MTNAELIAAIRGNDECNNCAIWKHGECNERKMSLATADALEAADKRIAELEAQIPKEGEWIEQDDGNSIYHKCSVCGKNQYNVLLEMMQGDYHYCPNCGAKMRGEQE